MTVSPRSTQGCFQWISGRAGGTQAPGLGVKHQAGLGVARLPRTLWAELDLHRQMEQEPPDQMRG